MLCAYGCRTKTSLSSCSGASMYVSYFLHAYSGPLASKTCTPACCMHSLCTHYLSGDHSQPHNTPYPHNRCPRCGPLAHLPPLPPQHTPPSSLISPMPHPQQLTKSAVTHKATKRALTQMTESLQDDLKEAGVTSIGVHNLSPGVSRSNPLMPWLVCTSHLCWSCWPHKPQHLMPLCCRCPNDLLL